MIRFLYWGIDAETKEKVHFIDENLYEVGWKVVTPQGQTVLIEDLAVEDRQVSVDELIEDWRLYP